MARFSSLGKRWRASSRLSKTSLAVSNPEYEEPIQRPDIKATFHFVPKKDGSLPLTTESGDLDEIILNEEGGEPETLYESRWSTTTDSVDSFQNTGPYPGVLEEYMGSSIKHRSKRLSAAIRKGIPVRQDLTELLCTAVAQGDVQMIGRIQSAGGDFAKKNSDGLQPIHIAAIAGQLGAAKALVLSGADINAKDSAGCTALHHAAKFPSDYYQFRPSTTASHRRSSSSQHSTLRFSYIVGELEKSNKRRPSYASSCSTASEDRCSVLEALLRSGANMEVCDPKGNSPLHIAVLTGDMPNITALLDRGANINARNKAGLTALGALIADEEHPNEAISRLLVNRGALNTPKEEREGYWFKKASL